MSRICVFAGSSPGARSEYAAATRGLASALVERGHELVYGGGNVGLMGVLADSVLARGGRVVGVIPEALVALEVAHHGLSELRVVASMHERKAVMSDLSDAFVALPGGLGTLEELFEVLTWAQLGLHAKPCALLNVAGYFDGLLTFLDRAVEERFLRSEQRALLIGADAPDALLRRIEAYRPRPVEKWIDRASA
jgi:uncharacterized protein (TIGR00730 family)